MSEKATGKEQAVWTTRPDVQPEPAVEQVFKNLVEQWRKETSVLSSIQAKIFNPLYQRIMTLGTQALPLIFRELRDHGGQWYWALECITGDNPAAGAQNISEAKRAWLTYAVQRGYLGADERQN
jgi:hypothetical protein